MTKYIKELIMALKQKKVIMGNRIAAIVTIVIACTLVLGATMFFNAKNTADMRELITKSIESQEMSALLAAKRMINVPEFMNYNTLSDTETAEYKKTLADLRGLAEDVNARYIYALKIIDGKAQFIFDTDTESDTRFKEYALYGVHEKAFAGKEAVGTRNVEDAWGSHNSGAIPLFYEGRVVGIVSVDFDDTLLAESDMDSRINSILLFTSLIVTMSVLIVITFSIRKLWVMHDETRHKSIHDTVTGLPNRHYLMDYLGACAEEKGKFAVVFIDLDNFKQVNDRFGHDAGDLLLKAFANYLNEILYDSESFRMDGKDAQQFSARLGGDEFVQVVSGVDSVEAAEAVAKKLYENFKNIDDPCIEPCAVGMSVGIAISPMHSSDASMLLKRADIAMYNAKHGGKNQYRIYTAGMRGKD
jgi:diguanylate cyclase (GGDEF)-like protein